MANKRASKKPGLRKVARKIRGAPKAPKVTKLSKKTAQKKASMGRPAIKIGFPTFLKTRISSDGSVC